MLDKEIGALSACSIRGRVWKGKIITQRLEIVNGYLNVEHLEVTFRGDLAPLEQLQQGMKGRLLRSTRRIIMWLTKLEDFAHLEIGYTFDCSALLI